MTTDQFIAITSPLNETFWLTTLKGQIIGANPSMEKLLGTKLSVLLGKYVQDFIDDPDKKLDAYIKMSSGTLDFVPSSLTIRDFEGRQHQQSGQCARLAPSDEEQGPQLLWRLVSKDDSRFKSLENELKSLQHKHHQVMDQRNHLDDLVATRTASLERRTNLKPQNQACKTIGTI